MLRVHRPEAWDRCVRNSPRTQPASSCPKKKYPALPKNPTREKQDKKKTTPAKIASVHPSPVLTPSRPLRMQVALPRDLAWIPSLFESTYFLPCPNHANNAGAGGGVAKGELTNLFCLSTRESLCSACAAHRSPDDVIQVRGVPCVPCPEPNQCAVRVVTDSIDVVFGRLVAARRRTRRTARIRGSDLTKGLFLYVHTHRNKFFFCDHAVESCINLGAIHPHRRPG